ncbi:hypothetical protein DYI23_05915 [Roseibium polysiphoniae]|uniref:Uncharacterized protein n=1 Tax=Roseibium polysiphoniae TaxID=2571221 RepID=A0A944GSR5_9HYPH|nr:hypothetical protein [Roseibium polysiphoniae]
MTNDLLCLIDRFLDAYQSTGRRMGDTTFGLRACKNGRLVSRLRQGLGRTVHTDAAAREFIRAESERFGISHLVFSVTFEEAQVAAEPDIEIIGAKL